MSIDTFWDGEIVPEIDGFDYADHFGVDAERVRDWAQRHGVPEKVLAAATVHVIGDSGEEANSPCWVVDQEGCSLALLWYGGGASMGAMWDEYLHIQEIVGVEPVEAFMFRIDGQIGYTHTASSLENQRRLSHTWQRWQEQVLEAMRSLA